MRTVKKYTNRKLYDTVDKKYISLDRISELVMSGEDVRIVDSKTGDDLTSATISQLLAREKNVPSGVLIQLLQKGRGTLLHASRQYFSLWQNALTMAEGEIDKLVNRMVKNNEISESEGRTLKRDYLGFAGNLKNWVIEQVDKRVAELSSMMTPTVKEEQLVERMEALEARLDDVERRLAKLDGRKAGMAGNKNRGNSGQKAASPQEAKPSSKSTRAANSARSGKSDSSAG
ncbi:MAG: polyhydroxyalkanoate synthesis regulator DNA-binding domain-containing protein [Desulfatibacillaceae bacterium]